MMTEETVVVNAQPTLMAQLRRFLLRVSLTLTLTALLVLLVQHQIRLVKHERILEHPVMAALDAAGVSIRATQLRATALVRHEQDVTMEELKRLAARIAAARTEHSDVELWSEVRPQYRVVYYRGHDEAGGTWTASARFLRPDELSTGRLEVALLRELVGRLDGMRSAMYQMEGQLQRAVGAPLREIELEASVEGRPVPRDTDVERLVDQLMHEMNVEAVTTHTRVDGVTARGYSPRLTTTPYEVSGARTNVAIRISRQGQGMWVEVGTPTL